MNSVKKSIRKFFTDKNGKIVIHQNPNAPLIIWLILTIFNHFVHNDPVEQVTRVVATTALFIWALLEIVSGASPYRRVLGTIVLSFIVIQLLR